MAQGLRVLTEKAVDPSLIPGTHVVGMGNKLQKDILWPLHAYPHKQTNNVIKEC